MEGGSLLAIGLAGLVFACVPSAANAQSNVTPAGIGFAADRRAHFDIFAGNGKTGSYTLSWNNLLVSREEPVTVVVDGETLKPAAYTLDAKKGIITFSKALKTTSVARVNYYYDPKLSRRNGGVSASPLNLPALRLAGTDLQVTALPKNDSEKGGFSAPLAFGTGKNLRLAGGGMTTKFNYAGADALGMQLGYKYGNQNNGFEGNFYRADKNLITRFGNTLGYADASRRWNMASRLTPAKWLGLTFTSNDGTDLNKNTQAGQNVFALRLGGVGTMPTVGVARTEVMTLDDKKKETSVTTDKVDMNLRVSPNTTFAVSNVKVTTDVPVANGDVTDENRSFTVSSVSANQKTQATLAFTGGLKETTGASEDRNGFALRLQAAPSFIVSAEKRDVVVTPLKPDGTDGPRVATSSQTFGAEISPMPNAKLTGQLTESETNDVGVMATTLSAQYGMGQPLEFSTGMTNRTSDAPGPEPLDTTRAQIAYRPGKGVTMTGGITWNPETQGQVSRAQRKEFGLTARTGAWEVGSAYSLTTLNGVTQWDDVDPQYGQFSLNLGLRLSRYSRVTGTYADSFRYRSASLLPPALVPFYTRVLGLGVTHDTGPSGFNLSFATTVTDNRANARQPREKKVEGKMGVRF
jgi:hypothetical protein